MLYIVYGCRETYQVTLGDAISSFLDTPDPTTKDRCLDEFERINKEWHGMLRVESDRHDPPRPKEYRPRSYRWAAATSKHRRYILCSL
jgi:hypothetical protein